jgi:hypothetical protein
VLRSSTAIFLLERHAHAAKKELIEETDTTIDDADDAMESLAEASESES